MRTLATVKKMAASFRGESSLYSRCSGMPSPKRRKFDTSTPGILPCLICNEQFRKRNDLWQHLTTNEKGINVFVCLNCGRGFCRDRLFRNHSCDNVNSDRASTDRLPMGLSVFCHVIACEECGLFVALVNVENPSWKSYSAFCAHPSRSYRKITLYTWTNDTIRFIRNDLSIPFTVRVDFGLSIDERIPLACELCGEKYTNIEDIEAHVSQRHGDQILPVRCDLCHSEFGSSLRLQLHKNEKHGGSKRELLDFLNVAVVEDPFTEQNSIGRTSGFVHCNLCETDILGSEFNNHDCAVHYTRRYLQDGKVLFCDAGLLQDCSIDMGIQEPMLLSLADKNQRHVELCLRFYVPVSAPKIDDFQEEPIYGCKHCEFIFVNQSMFRDHVTETLDAQAIGFEWPGALDQHSTLTQFGLLITVSDQGLICPKADCGTTWCSPVGLERHMKTDHADTFQPLTIPNWATSVSNDSVVAPGLLCFVCQEADFNPEHVREYHLNLCYNCGSCFGSQEQLNIHQSTACRRDSNTNTMMSYCKICQEVFLILSDYYLHLVSQHVADLNYDETAGEILPKCGFTRARNINTNDIGGMANRAEMASVTQEVDVSEVAWICKDEECQVIDNCDQSSGIAAGIRTTVASDDDDEIAVCDPEPSTSQGREPIHGCDYCSQKFFTLKVAEEHRQTHVYDAGLITKLVLPVPTGMDVYVCRLCCLAYEWYPAYSKHMDNHKLIVECDQCSAVCLNAAHLDAHLEAHNTGSLVYGCYSCLIALRSETALMIHMNELHGLPLLWFCKLCGQANTDHTKMISHSCVDTDGRQVAPIVLPTIKPKLHFQPREDMSAEEFFNKYSDVTQRRDVAECPHRSFLACKETTVACLTCGSIITAASYLLSTPDKEQHKGRVKFTLVDELSELTLIKSHPFYKRTKTAVLSNYTYTGLKQLLKSPSTLAPNFQHTSRT